MKKAEVTTGFEDAIRDIMSHHLTSFLENDLEAVMSDYTNESVLIARDRIYAGIREIRAFFAALMVHFPKNESRFDLDKMVVQDDMVYIIWHANTPSIDVPLGSDTFILKDGKILQQTFIGQIEILNVN
jgi:ketosteroid isomerase-like protein